MKFEFYSKEKIQWGKTSNPEFPFIFQYSDFVLLQIRINDFPEEPMYTLIENDLVICSFDNWPITWIYP